MNRRKFIATTVALLLMRCLDLPAAEPVFRLKPDRAKQRLVLREQIEVEKLTNQIEGAAFLALPPTNWWPELVPVFGVDKEDSFELRRRPPRGQENFTEPLFFALPLRDEPDAARIAGRWECTAKRDGTENWFAWELTAETDKLAGRFDQGTDYRVAFITGGTFRSNRFTLTVEHNADRYELSGDWRDGALSGDWRHLEHSEKSTWQAKRLSQPPASDNPRDAVPLYEFRRVADGARRYSVESKLPESGWERQPRPLCRVWRAAREQPRTPSAQ